MKSHARQSERSGLGMLRVQNLKNAIDPKQVTHTTSTTTSYLSLDAMAIQKVFHQPSCLAPRKEVSMLQEFAWLNG